MNSYEMDRMVLGSYNKNRYCVISSFNESEANCELIEKPLFLNKNMIFNFGKVTIYVDVFNSLIDAKEALKEFNEVQK